MSESATLEAQISQQIVAAMKAHDAERTGTLRMIKTALMNKAIEKRAAQKQIGATLTARPNRSHGMNHKLRRQPVRLGQPRLARRAAADPAALIQERRAGCAMNRPIHAAAAQQ